MAKTVESSAASYCPPGECLKRSDWRVFADLCSDTGVRLADAATVAADPNFNALLQDASGLVEQAVVAGGRYHPSDLQALTGVGLAGLYRLVCRLAVVLAFERRPDREMKQPWVGERAMADLDALRSGLAVFPFVEAEAAGNANQETETARDVENRNGLSYVTRRVLGTRANRRGPSGGGW